MPRDDLQRLERLARLGDRDAAEQLLVAAERAADPRLASLARRALGDTTAAGQEAAALWTAGDLAGLTSLARAWGVVLEPGDLERLEASRVDANGNRRVRLLDRADVLAALFEARRSSAPCVFVTGGRRRQSMGQARTTLCLAVCRDTAAAASEAAGLTVAVVDASGATADPARAWPDELRPWRQVPERNRERLQAWASNPAADRFTLATCPLDDLLAGLEPGDATEAAPALTPEQQLEALCDGPATEAAFRELVKLVDAWPKREADAIAATVARRLGEAAWPDELRVATRPALKRIAARRRKPADLLYRHARLVGPASAEIQALVGCEFARQLTVLTLELDANHAGLDSACVAAIVASPHLGALRVLRLAGDRGRFLPALGALLASPPLPALRELDLSGFGGSFPEVAAPALLEGVETLRFFGERWPGCALTPIAARALAASPAIASLRAVMVRGGGPHGSDAIARLIASPHLGPLRTLHVGAAPIDAAAIDALAAMPLEDLELVQVELDADALARILAGTPGRTLRRLVLTSGHKGDAMARTLERAERLEELELRWAGGHDRHPVLSLETGFAAARITADGGRALARTPWLASARRLVLPGNAFGDEGVAALIAALDAPSLDTLELGDCRLGVGAARAIAASPALRRLRRLVLSDNAIGDEGFIALVTSPHLEALEALELAWCHIGPRGARALAESEHLPALRHLDLTRNPLEDSGAEALAMSPALARLERLALHGTRIRKRGIQALATSRWLAGRFDGLPGHTLR